MTASLVGKYLPWRAAYLVGGGLGLVLLWAVGGVCIILALVSLMGMAETAGRDLDFLE